MSVRQLIVNFIKDEYLRHSIVISPDFEPTLAFGLSNIKSKTSNVFKVKSVAEAEDIVISFISTAQRDKIFSRSEFKESKDLYLTVNLILST